MKNNRNIIECCNITHQAAPRTGKQTCACASDPGDTIVALLVVQGVSKAFSKAYHKVDARQKLVRMCRRAGSWLIHCCTRVQSVDVYSVGRDVVRQCPLIQRVLTTARRRIVACDHSPAIKLNDNLFLSVFLSSVVLLNPLKRSGVRWLHFGVFSAIQV